MAQRRELIRRVKEEFDKGPDWKKEFYKNEYMQANQRAERLFEE